MALAAYAKAVAIVLDLDVRAVNAALTDAYNRATATFSGDPVRWTRTYVEFAMAQFSHTLD